ncbi:MAG: toll/interleukin-1 receptor domain-containing protein [Proteobacteria bacterium]|nr:toll/interleukin-1 receptor domain-containing protein [Pseudomonadota bacterium]
MSVDLQKNNVRCWLATEDFKIGDKQRDKIDKAIKIHDKLLLILSEASIASQWVNDEVESAFEKENKRKSKGNEEPVLFPIRIDDSVMHTDQAWAAKIRRSRHMGDFTDWKDHDQYQKAFKRLLRDLQESSKPSSK